MARTLNISNSIYFMPLGGGQEIGNSCYFLRLGETNVMMDAGYKGWSASNSTTTSREPELNHLLESPFVSSLEDIDVIIISHAHYDHVGYLDKILKNNTKARVFMTETTKILAEYQLKHSDNDICNFLDRIETVSFLHTYEYKDIEFTFTSAGHMPGAMMTLIQYKGHNIVYTGDFSFKNTSLTDECMIPDVKVDTLIMCGTNAKRFGYKSHLLLDNTVNSIYNTVYNEKKVVCSCNQLSKSVELLKALTERNIFNIKIYVDDSLIPLIEHFEKIGIKLLDENTELVSSYPEIYGTNQFIYLVNNIKIPDRRITVLKPDFSLHVDFNEMRELIKTIQADQIYMVHCGNSWDNNLTIEQDLMLDSECLSQFTFAETGELYNLK